MTSWLQRQRKGDLQNLAENAGIKEYVVYLLSVRDPVANALTPGRNTMARAPPSSEDLARDSNGLTYVARL
jgi:hypothetical protein